MHHPIFFFAAMTLLFTASCTRESAPALIEVDTVMELSVAINGWGEVDFATALDGRLHARYDEGIGLEGQDCGLGSHVFSGKINTPAGVAAGAVLIQGQEVHIAPDPTAGGSRYVLHNPALAAGIPGQLVQFNFVSKAPTLFASFQHHIRAPLALCASANFASADYLNKNHDLVINWQPDPDNYDNPVWISLCAAGAPCLERQVADTGQYTFGAADLAYLTAGDWVLLQIGRGRGALVKQTDGGMVGLGVSAMALRSAEVID